MDPISAIAAIGATTAYNSLSASASSDRQYKYTRRLQKHEQAFQERMSNTAIQRQMADADAAGLNAHLLYNNGASGASTPSGGHGGVNGPEPQTIDAATAVQFAMQKERQDAEIDALEKQTNADVELKNAQAIKAMKEAGYKQHEIDYYINNGVFPGATETRSSSYKGPLGIGGGITTTRPIRNKNTAYNDGLSNWEKEHLSRMPKEKWQKLSKAQRMMFPRELRELYNQYYQ